MVSRPPGSAWGARAGWGVAPNPARPRVRGAVPPPPPRKPRAAGRGRALDLGPRPRPGGGGGPPPSATTRPRPPRGAAPRRARRPCASRAPPELVAPGAVAQRPAPRPLVVVRHPQELERGGAAEARLERPALDGAVRDVNGPDPERCRLHALLRPVVQRGDKPARGALEANHDEGHVRDLDRNPDARLDEIGRAHV